ncbi:MAG: hypothetical protein GC205_00450 [Bacteroidetes bacterium]|nr:hypothetical protein [Bacteroidota bacterium]
MIKTENFEQVEVHSKEELWLWLENNHQQTGSIWLVTFKISVPDKYLYTSDILDQLLCFGWIDGIRRKLDNHRTMQLISPRKAEHWAKTYKDRASKLIKEGKMQNAGARAIEASKQKGLWDFMNDVDNLVVPQDLKEALARYDTAAHFFDCLNDSSKRFVLRWIKLAKTEKTRASRIDQLAQLSAKGEKLKGS